ncbi:hypothetical protein ACHWQZ_G014016 [Mnemiopsis leidyi]
MVGARDVDVTRKITSADINGTRQREVGEITPVRAQHSATQDKDEEMYGAGNAIDLDPTTRSSTVPDSDGTTWLKVTLDKVHCVDKVIWYLKDASLYHLWTCTDNDCGNCVGDKCGLFNLTVSTEGRVSDLSPVPECGYGDTVKLEKDGSMIYVNELVVIGKEEADCTTHDSTWSNVVTVPALPVVHGTTLTLNCPGGYTNLGGNTATCLYGQVVPTNQPPDCSLAIREKVAGEVTPVNAQQSATYQKDEEQYGARRAIDLDLTTRSWIDPNSGGSSWLKVRLGKVLCVRRGIWYYKDGPPYLTWTCTHNDCNNCEGRQCDRYTLTVSTAEEASDLWPVSDCRYGDTAQLGKPNGGSFYVWDIAIICKETSCTTKDLTWSNVVTVPALPVEHGTTLTLNCPGGYTNLGGNTASCLYGQVVPTNQPPDCRGKHK